MVNGPSESNERDPGSVTRKHPAESAHASAAKMPQARSLMVGGAALPKDGGAGGCPSMGRARQSARVSRKCQQLQYRQSEKLPTVQ